MTCPIKSFLEKKHFVSYTDRVHGQRLVGQDS